MKKIQNQLEMFTDEQLSLSAMHPIIADKIRQTRDVWSSTLKLPSDHLGVDDMNDTGIDLLMSSEVIVKNKPGQNKKSTRKAKRTRRVIKK